MPHIRRHLLTGLMPLCLLLSGPVAWAADAPGASPSAAPVARSSTTASAPAAAARPKIGLVLSGGGARGLAHVGVLKVLERERIPVDVIAGTSMGAIVGGLYASGMSAAEIEVEVVKLDWDNVFSSRVDRTELPHRRKEQDFEVAPLLELGVNRSGPIIPLAPVSSRGLEEHLRRMTLKAGQTKDFDKLPTPFRAVATDMETGQAVILKRGDLAMALRSSMSIPAVFAPVELDGRILGDGGLVNNVPVDVARAMGAQRLLVVNVGTPLSGRDTLNSLGGLTSQMITILTEQNVTQSLRTLTPRDVLITPQLDGMSAGSFSRAPEFIRLGELQGEALVLRMQDLKVSEADYAAWKTSRRTPQLPSRPLRAVAFDGAQVTQPQRHEARMVSRSGEVFSLANAERDVRLLGATGDYSRTDYRLTSKDDDEPEALVFKLEEKPWGPGYLQLGLDFSTDTDGRTAFNVKMVHTQRWLDERGSEWRNFARLGTAPLFSTELYSPLTFDLPNGLRPFASAKATFKSQSHDLFNDPQQDPVLRLTRRSNAVNLDLGASWRELGDLRMGYAHVSGRDSPDLVTPMARVMGRSEQWLEQGLRASVVLDQLDAAYFPTRGWRLDTTYFGGQRSGAGLPDSATGWFNTWQFAGETVTSFDKHGLQLSARLAGSSGAKPEFPRYGLGGFQQLSGYAPWQYSGNQVALLTLGYTYKLTTLPLTRGVHAGFTLESGKAWDVWNDSAASGWRQGGSLYLGADTPIGPVQLGVGMAQGVKPTLMLFLGRP